MENEAVLNRIKELEQEIESLPEGGISRKNIKGKDYYYHRINRNGKRTETYLSFDKVAEFQQQIDRRKELEAELRKLKRLSAAFSSDSYETVIPFKTTVIYGKRLELANTGINDLPKRKCLDKLTNYLYGPVSERVFIIYGLRRTGKTTLIRQTIAGMSEADFKKTAYIQISSTDTLSDLYSDLNTLQNHGFRYIFIDEVTLLDDFTDGAALLADVYAGSGMKIVLTGNDTMKFAFCAGDQLYDRCQMLHTTFIPYREYIQIRPVLDLEQYLRCAGTINSNISTESQNAFDNIKSTAVYVQTAVGNNILNSMKQKDGSCRSKKLQALFDSGDLVNTVRTVVSNTNKDFCRRVLEKSFINLAAMSLLKDKNRSFDLRQHLNNDPSSMALVQMQDLLSKNRQDSASEDRTAHQIKEYLKVIDLITDIESETLPDKKTGVFTVFTQPGLRYSQVCSVIDTLLNNPRFKALSLKEQHNLRNILQKSVSEQMTEDLILLETKNANPDKKVFRLNFSVGGFDMVIFDPHTLSCRIYEIKHTNERSVEQHHHLIDEQKCILTRHSYGDITGKYVIYPGETAEFGDIRYINTEEYLKSLGEVNA